MKTAKQRLTIEVMGWADRWPVGHHEIPAKTHDGREVILDLVVTKFVWYEDFDSEYSAECEAIDASGDEMPEHVLEFWLDNSRWNNYRDWIQDAVEEYIGRPAVKCYGQLGR